MPIQNKEVVINPKKTYTKSEYAKNFNISRPTIDKKIETKEIEFTEVNGTVLIHAK